MNDLEICKRIAEIEGIKNIIEVDAINPYIGILDGTISSLSPAELIGKFDPLTDDALCFRLMVKHGVIVFHRYENDILICWAEHSDGTGEIGKPIFAPAGSDLEAVKQCACLAIIEVNK